MVELCSCLPGVENWQGQGNTLPLPSPKKESGVLSIFQAQGVGRDASREELCSSLERCTVPPLNVTFLLPRPTSASRLDGHAHSAVSLGTCAICTGTLDTAKNCIRGKDVGLSALAFEKYGGLAS